MRIKLVLVILSWCCNGVLMRHGLGAHIIADGGCTCPGDVAKGFGGGADFVMLEEYSQVMMRVK